MEKCALILRELEALGSEANRAGMSRFGITTERAYGVSMGTLRTLAKRIGRDHALAQELWASGVHEARILASIVDVPKQVDEGQMEAWAAAFNSWDLCDQVCGNLFAKTPLAHAKVLEWAARDAEFVRRAGFTLMAQLAVHDKKAGDDVFVQYLDVIEQGADDDRNYVKKAVNWALRQIGKRNSALHEVALHTAAQLRERPSRAARWIGADAWRELTSPAVRSRLRV